MFQTKRYTQLHYYGLTHGVSVPVYGQHFGWIKKLIIYLLFSVKQIKAIEVLAKINCSNPLVLNLNFDVLNLNCAHIFFNIFYLFLTRIYTSCPVFSNYLTCRRSDFFKVVDNCLVFCLVCIHFESATSGFLNSKPVILHLGIVLWLWKNRCWSLNKNYGPVVTTTNKVV